MWHGGWKGVLKRFLVWIAVAELVKAQYSSNNDQINAIEYSELKCDFDLSTGNQICDCQHRNEVNIYNNEIR